MHKMLRDMEEYRRMEFKRHMALMDQITLNSTRMLNDNMQQMPSRSLSQEKLPLISNNLHAKKPSAMSPMRQARRVLKKPSDVKKMLKAVAWALAFPGLWFNSVTIWAEKRCAVELYKLKDDVPQYLEMFLKLASQTVNNEVKKLVEEKNSLTIVTARPLKTKDLDSRCTIIQEYLVLIIDQLSLQVAKDLLPTSFFTFLSNLSENDAIIPQDFLSGFEISRLDFNMFGNLKNVNEWKSKMILACYLLLKGVVYFLLIRPQAVTSSINEKQLNIRNMFTVSSILYHVVMDVLEERVPLADPVRFRPQIQVAPTTLSAFDNKRKEKLLEVPPEYNPKDKNDVISGFYSREQLAEFLDNRPKIANEVRDAVRDFLDVIYDITHRVVNKKSHVKQWFGSFRKGSPQKRR